MFGIARIGGSSNAPTSNDDHTWAKIVQVLQKEDINTILKVGGGGVGGEVGPVSRTIGLIMHLNSQTLNACSLRLILVSEYIVHVYVLKLIVTITTCAQAP